MDIPGLEVENLPVKLINTQLSGQFLTHMSVSFYAGILLASPYILYQLFHFISPALYQNEKKYSSRLVFWGYLLFLTGVLFSYFHVPFPVQLPGESGSGKHHPAQFLHRHAEHAEPDDGHHIRDTHSDMATGPIRHSFCRLHGTIQKTRLGGRNDYSCHHHSYLGRVYHADCHIPYCYFIRSQHPRRTSYGQKGKKLTA